jgi:hypothetical protein
VSFTAPSLTVSEETNLAVQLTATDSAGATVTFAKVSDPAHGSLSSFSSTGSFVYLPALNYSGTDSFNVSVSNGRGGSVTGTVTITVTNVNDAPQAQDDFLEVSAADLNSLAVKANDSDVDGDALTVSIVEAFPVGVVGVNANGTISISGLPADFAGTLGFKYRITDPSGLSSTASAVVFVDVPGYRVAFRAQSVATGLYDVYLSDLVTTRRVTQSVTGDAGLDQSVLSFDGSTLAFTRSDLGSEASRQSSGRLYVMRTAPGSAPIEVQAPAGMEFAVPSSLNLAPPWRIFISMALSNDGRWLAFLARPVGNASSGPIRLYVVDTQQSARPLVGVRVGNDVDHLYSTNPVFVGSGDTLAFVASSVGVGIGVGVVPIPGAVYEANASSPGGLRTVSEPQASGTAFFLINASRSGRRYLLSGSRSGVSRFVTVERNRLGVETFLNPMQAGDVLFGAAISPDEDISHVVFAIGPSGIGAREIRRVSADGSNPTSTCTFTAGWPTTVSSLTVDGGRAMIRRLPPGLSLSGQSSTTPYTLEETDFATCNQTVVDSGLAQTGYITPNGKRILASGSFSVSNWRVYARGDYANPKVLAPAFAPFSNVGMRALHLVSSDGAALYLTNIFAPEAWYSPTDQLVGVTNPVYQATVDMKR